MTVPGVGDRFGALLAADPDGAAIEYRQRTTTYRELAAAAHSLRGTLSEAGVGSGDRVGVLAEDRRLVVVCLLGILEAGAIFVPLDPAHPRRYSAKLARTANLHCLVVEDGAAEMTDLAATTIATSAEWLFAGAGLNGGGPAIAPHGPSDPAYIYFSSGTTGDSKPIVGRLDALAHFVRWEICELAFRPGVRVGQVTSPGHDPYLREVFVALLTGGTLSIPDSRDVLLSPQALRHWIAEAGVQVLHCTPTIVRTLCRGTGDTGELASLECVLIAGEQLYGSDVARWHERFGDRVQLVNLYGPTETTLAKLFHRVAREDGARQAVPIGRPIADTSAHVLSPDMTEVATGEVGELYIETAFATLGYLNRPDLTQRVFSPPPAAARGLPVTYRTGDLVRRLADGDLEFVGRCDRQVKIAGVRVEPEAVESAVMQYPGVSGCVVASQERDPERPTERLIAYYAGVNAPTPGVLKRYLEERLPTAMVPNVLVRRADLPVNLNGKVDRRALASGPPVEAPEEDDPPPAGEPTTNRLLLLWREILGDDAVGVDDVFMDRGGDSLSVMLLIDRVAEAFDYELPLIDVFDDLTVLRLSESIERDGDDAPDQ